MTRSRKLPSTFTSGNEESKREKTLAHPFLNFAQTSNDTSSSSSNVDPALISSRKRYPMNGVEIDFPFEAYPSQVRMMLGIVRALQRSENALLESPTGSGKSLALLCATLAWRENEKKRVAAELLEQQKAYTESMRYQYAVNEHLHRAIGNRPTFSPAYAFQQRTDSEERTANQPSADYKKTINLDSFKYQCAEVEGTKAMKEEKETSTGKRKAVMDDDDDFQQPRYIRKKKVNPSGRLSPSIDHDMLSPTAASAFQTKDPSKSTSYRIPKIFVCSRTHKQLAQLVGELKGNTTYRPRMTVLGSREQLCIHPKVSKSSNKSEDCFNLLEARECIYGRRVAQLLGDLQISRGVNPIWDIEDLVTLGKKTRGCPYYSARTLYEHAELVFCPYNYIIDPNIRSALDIDLENNIVIIDEAHNIEDAARSAGSFEINEMELKILQLELNQISKRELSADSHGQILFLVDSLLDWMQSPENVHNIKEFDRDVALWDGHQLVPKLSSVGITQSIFHTTLVFAHQAVRRHADEIRKKNESRGTDLDMVYEDDEPFSSQNQKYTVRECVSDYGLRLLSGLFMVLGYIFDKEHAHAKDYRMVLIKRKNRTTKPQNEADAWVHKLAFWCLNPGIIFRDISEKVHSVILTSGTLSPMDTFARELETDFPIRVEAKHVIDSSQVWVRTLPRGPGQVILSGTFNNVESFAYQDDVGEALLNVVRAVPYGVLCFFPSYRAIDTLVKRWKTTGLYQQLDQQKHVMLEPHQGARNAFDKTLKKFYGHIQKAQEGMFGSGKDGALFLAVYRGKASEGIDFSNNNCRAVVALGIPYPNIKDIQIKLKKEYNDMRRKEDVDLFPMKPPEDRPLTGSEWYDIQAYRAINQAIGRCIRHRNDWGVIILLEERFHNNEYAGLRNRRGLSKWVRELCVQNPGDFGSAMKELQSFVRRRIMIDQGLAVEEEEEKKEEHDGMLSDADLNTDMAAEMHTDMDADMKPMMENGFTGTLAAGQGLAAGSSPIDDRGDPEIHHFDGSRQSLEFHSPGSVAVKMEDATDALRKTTSPSLVQGPIMSQGAVSQFNQAVLSRHFTPITNECAMIQSEASQRQIESQRNTGSQTLVQSHQSAKDTSASSQESCLPYTAIQRQSPAETQSSIESRASFNLRNSTVSQPPICHECHHPTQPSQVHRSSQTSEPRHSPPSRPSQSSQSMSSGRPGIVSSQHDSEDDTTYMLNDTLIDDAIRNEACELSDLQLATSLQAPDASPRSEFPDDVYDDPAMDALIASSFAIPESMPLPPSSSTTSVPPTTIQKDQSVKILCIYCDSTLCINAQCASDITQTNSPLQYIKDLTAKWCGRPVKTSTCRVFDLHSPASWSFEQFAGIRHLDPTTGSGNWDVQWQIEDKLCYKPLVPTCCETRRSKPIGALICTATSGAPPSVIDLVGKVYLLEDAVYIQSDAPVSCPSISPDQHHGHASHTTNVDHFRSDECIPRGKLNDLFYDLV